MEDRNITVQLSRSECSFLKQMINAVVDDGAECAHTKHDMMVLDLCSTIYKRIDDAVQGR